MGNRLPSRLGRSRHSIDTLDGVLSKGQFENGLVVVYFLDISSPGYQVMDVSLFRSLMRSIDAAQCRFRASKSCGLGMSNLIAVRIWIVRPN